MNKNFLNKKNNHNKFEFIKIVAILLSILSLGIMSSGQYIASVFAAPGTSLSLSPGSTTVSTNSNVTFNINLNTGGESVNGISVKLTYDQSRLQFVSFDSSSSSFAIKAEDTGGGGQATYSAGNITPINSSGANVAKVTFKALTSGSANVNIDSGASAVVSSTTNQNVLSQVSGATINVPGNPSPNPTPNPTPTPTPAPTPSPTPSPAPSPAPARPTSSSNSTPQTSNWEEPSSDLKKNPNEAPQSTSSDAPQLSDVKIDSLGYKEAIVSWVTNKSSTSSINLGTEKDSLGVVIKGAENSTNHTVNIDQAYLKPGTTYYFQINSLDSSGEKTVSPTYSFVTKGYEVITKVVDKNNKPVADVEVTLNSDVRVALTDDSGDAKFSKVAPGAHTVTFNYDGDEYKQTIEVQDTLGLNSGSVSPTQSPGAAQVFELSLNKSKLAGITSYLWVLIIPVVLVGGYLIFKNLLPRLRAQKGLVNASPTGTGATNSQSGTKIDTQDVQSKHAIDFVEGVATEKPGQTITPKIAPEDSKKED